MSQPPISSEAEAGPPAAPDRSPVLDPACPSANAGVLAAGWKALVAAGALVADAGGARFGVRASACGPVDFAEWEGRCVLGQRRRVGEPDLLFQHSPAREFKPGGLRVLVPGRQIHPAFENDGSPCRFHEEDPAHPHSIRRREPLARLELGRGWAVLPNLSPYEPLGTFVAVPSPRPGEFPHEPQRLGRVAAADLLALGGAFDRHLAFYNASHCGASVNHLHLQLVALPESLPVERARTIPRAGWRALDGYPARGLAFDLTKPGERESLLRGVDRLEARHRHFNLLVLDTRAWLFGRNPDREVVDGYPGVVAGYELAGVILFVRGDHFAGADPAAVVRALTLTTLPVEELIDLLR